MLSRIKKSIIDHKLAVIVAVLFTIAIILPRLISIASLGHDFKGVYPTFIEDETHYLARVSSVVNGDLFIGNPYLKEHEKDIFAQPPLPEWLIALLSEIFSLSVPLAMLLSGYLIVPSLFLLSYFLFHSILKEKIYSVLFTSFFFILFFQTFGRPISPQLTMLFLLPGLILIFKNYINNGVNKPINLWLGFITGLCLFVSPYYWTALVVLYFLTTLAGLALAKGTKESFHNLKFYLTSFIPLAIIYTASFLTAKSSPWYLDLSYRIGMIYSHWPGAYSNILLSILVFIILFIYRTRIDKKSLYLSFCLILSVFILNWQNVISGQALQFPSHYLVVTILFVLLSSAIILKAWFLDRNSSSKLYKFIVPVSLALFFAVLTIRQYREFTVRVPRVPERSGLLVLEERQKIFEWLNKNTPPNSVINVLGSDVNPLITIYTRNKPYFDPYSIFYLVSDEEIQNRWFIQNIFVSNFNLDYVRANQKDIWGNKYVDSYFFMQNKDKILSLLGYKRGPQIEMIPDNLISPLVARYNDLKKEDKKILFKRYEMDYILLSKNYPYYTEAQNGLAKLTFLTKVYTDESFIIYKVN